MSKLKYCLVIFLGWIGKTYCEIVDKIAGDTDEDTEV